MRVIRQNRAGTHDDGTIIGTHLMGLLPGLLGGDPLARPVGGRDVPVQGRRDLPHHPGPTTLHVEGVVGVEQQGVIASDPGYDLDPRILQSLHSPARLRVGIPLGDDDALHTCRDERLGARTGTSGVVARFQGDDGSGTTRSIPGVAQRLDLGMGSARPVVIPLPDDRVVTDDDAAHSGIGVAPTAPGSSSGKLKCSIHGSRPVGAIGVRTVLLA